MNYVCSICSKKIHVFADHDTMTMFIIPCKHCKKNDINEIPKQPGKKAMKSKKKPMKDRDKKKC